MDIKQTIEGLEKLCKSNNCPFVCFDALELLKEQQQKKDKLLKRFDEEIESVKEAIEDCACDGDHSGVAYFQSKQRDYRHAKSIIENIL